MYNKYFLLIFLALISMANAQNAEPLDKILAIAEDEIILQSDLNLARKNVMMQLQSQNIAPPPEDILKRQLMERLVITKLQLQKARMGGIRVSNAEVDETIRKVAASNKMTVPQMRDRLSNDGLDFESFWEQIHTEMTIGKLRQRLARSKVDVSESEIDIYLNSGQSGNKEYRLAHILLSLPREANPDDIAKAREKANEIRQEIEQGLPFSQAAITYSQGQTALEGGDLGWRSASKLPEDMLAVLGKLEQGGVSEPVRGPGGIHLIKVMEMREQQHMVEEVHAHHILIKTDELVSSTDAYENIRTIHDQLLDGADFAELAKEHSQDLQSSNQGGDMGWQSLESFGGVTKETLAKLEPGEISQPFQTRIGWHIVRIDDRRSRDATSEFTRQQAREAIFERKAEYEIELFLRQMRDEAYVEFLDGSNS